MVFASLFANNSAIEGGAVYMGTDGKFLSTWNDFHGNEAVVAGGAISACATEEDATCAGTVHIFGSIASSNRVTAPDGEDLHVSSRRRPPGRGTPALRRPRRRRRGNQISGAHAIDAMLSLQVDAVRHAIDTEADARSSGDGSPLGSFDGRNYFPGTHARRHARTRHGAGSLSSVQSRTSLRLPSLLSRRGSSKRRLTSESPATIKARACDERGRLTSHSTSGTNSGTGDSRVSRKLVNFRTLTWQSSQGESKEDSGPPTF